MTRTRILLGLHLTKCAGTSLITTVRRGILDDQYCVFSSFYQNVIASRPLLSTILNRDPLLSNTANQDRLRFVFGHYMHETLLSVFQPRPVFLFTGLREPVARAISHFGQINSVRAMADQPLMPAAQFLASGESSMCAQILRAFPSAGALAEGPSWRQACAVLSLFDYVYSTNAFTQDVLWLLDLLKIPHEKLVADNVYSEKILSPEAAAFISAGSAEIEAAPAVFFEQDVALYAAFEKYLGRRNFREAVRKEDWALNREAFVGKLPEPSAALRAFRDLETNYMVNEFRGLGKLAILERMIESEIEDRKSILRQIANYSA